MNEQIKRLAAVLKAVPIDPDRTKPYHYEFYERQVAAVLKAFAAEVGDSAVKAAIDAVLADDTPTSEPEWRDFKNVSFRS